MSASLRQCSNCPMLGRSPCGGDQLVDGWVVAGVLGSVAVDNFSARHDHKDPTLLPGIALNCGLPVAIGKSAPSIAQRAYAETRTHTAMQVKRAVGVQLWICINLATKAGFFAESGDKIRLSVAHDDQLCSDRSETIFRVMQLHHLLLAEQSTKMADKCQDNWIVNP